jgi:2-polyprenyl-6-methoxyphenol hydroxylase-like FAD-dependent oxidoreductase
MNPDFDLTIMGGGLAGLCLAIQIKNARPETTIFLVDKHRHPVQEAAFKVGESSSESSAHYFANVLGMKRHLDEQQLQKLGLRFFFTAKGNHNLTERVEAGPTFFPHVPGYQLDRGRFENHLMEECRARNVEIREGASIRDVTVSKDAAVPHTVVVQNGAEQSTVSSRWLVDAAGRSGVLRKRLGLDKKTGHICNASWFRVADVIAIEDWHGDPRWQALVPGVPRSLSTTHMMGNGYWVWLIRLACGSTSVGIVADATIHPIETINTFERSLDWLRKFEPQCARVVEARMDKLQDFLTLKGFAHSATRVYSHHRWCLTGDAGPFTDPLYSPGSDFIAFGNTYITDLIVRDFAGDNLTRRTELYNRAFLATYESFLSLYENRYPIMGNAQIMIAKVVWDYAAYWTNIALLFFRRKLTDFEFMTSNLPLWQPMLSLNRAMQEFLTVWNEFEQTEWKPRYVDTSRIPFLYDYLHRNLAVERTDEDLRTVLQKHAVLLDNVALEFARHAIGDGSDPGRREALCPVLPERIRDRFLQGDSCPEIARDLEYIWLEANSDVPLAAEAGAA